MTRPGAFASFFVPGQPWPKGSKTRVGNRLVEVADMARKHRKAGALKTWMTTVAGVARQRCSDPMTGPVELDVTFFLRRPKTARRRWPSCRPDASKLLRAVEDALSGIVYRDDAQIIDAIARKRYALDDNPGALILIREVPDA